MYPVDHCAVATEQCRSLRVRNKLKNNISSLKSSTSGSPYNQDDQNNRKIRTWTTYTTFQLHKLEEEFNNHQWLIPSKRKRLADCLKLSEVQITKWFYYRRRIHETEITMSSNMHNNSKNDSKWPKLINHSVPITGNFYDRLITPKPIGRPPLYDTLNIMPSERPSTMQRVFHEYPANNGAETIYRSYINYNYPLSHPVQNQIFHQNYATMTYPKTKIERNQFNNYHQQNNYLSPTIKVEGASFDYSHVWPQTTQQYQHQQPQQHHQVCQDDCSSTIYEDIMQIIKSDQQTINCPQKQHQRQQHQQRHQALEDYCSCEPNSHEQICIHNIIMWLHT